MIRKFFQLKQLNNEDGSALMSVMIIGSIILVLVGAYASYQFQRNKELQAQDTRNVYNQLKTNMKTGSAQTQSISQSEQLDFSSMK